MTITLSDRVQRVKPSATLAVSARAAQARAAGEDIIGLGTGEPDFDTPDHIKDAAIAAIRAGDTKYTAVDGTPALKQAVIDKFQRDNRLTYTPEQILISVGGKQSFFNLAQALLNDGDEVVVPAPYWVSYPDIVALANAKPVILKTTLEQRFKITASQLDAAITSKTRLVVFNSPSNPSGMMYSSHELRALADVLLKHPHVLLATDDMYEHILWHDEPFNNILTVCPELYERTIVLNGVSKAYAMTGWRIGYAGGPKSLIQAMKKIQSQSTSNPTSIAQAAAVAALSGDQTCVKNMTATFKQRHDFVYQGLQAIPGIEVEPSDGTFYIFPRVQGLIDRMDGVNNDVDLAEHLITQAKLALVPGSAFGAEGCLRLSFAASDDTLRQALERLAAI